MSDLISRQAAITAIQNAYCDTEGGEDKCAVWKNVGLTNALHIVQDLPSAQPEIIRCKDCKWYTVNELKKDGTDDRRYKPSYCLLYSMRRDEDWFCADGERREDDSGV